MKSCLGWITLISFFSMLTLGAQADVTRDVILRAANITPSPAQMAWQEREMIAFIHFTVNTFTDMEWGTGEEDPSIFNPSDLDPRQWVQVCKEAGMQTVILTAKHHDGFCLWPSQYTEHSVKNSPWKNGQGDVVKELAEACREAGLKMGLYLSPWDRNNPAYGDQVRYNEYYKNQLREILSQYGEVVEVWFDGAKGPDAKDMEYNWAEYYAIVRELQPNAVMFNGPDVRWVGNESGFAREMEWSVVAKRPGSLFELVNPMAKDLGSRAILNTDSELVWYPAETDVSIRPGWFYHATEDDKVKTPAQLMDIYYKSIGRNSVLLLNLPPDRRGRIQENDIASLRQFRKILDLTFSIDHALHSQATASSCRDGNQQFGAQTIVDGEKETYWMTDDWVSSATVELDLGTPKTFNRVMLQEYIPVGQRVEAFTVQMWDGQGWTDLAQGTTIGYKRILLVPDTTTSKLRVIINESRVCPTLSHIGLFYQPPVDAIP